MSVAAPGVIGCVSPRLGDRCGRLRGRGRALVDRARALGLVARFMLVGITVALVVAGALGSFVEARVTEFAHEQLKARAVDQVKLGVQGHVDPEDFEPPYTPEKLDDLAARLHPLLSRAHDEGSGVIRLHLFDRSGTIIYSDVLSKRGYVTNLTTSPLLGRALEGEVGTKISTLSSAKTAELKARYGEALEVYAPFALDGRVVGAYEIYQDLAPIRPIRPMVWGAVLAGFAVLMLSLYGVVRWADGIIRSQQAEREAALREAAEAERRAADGLREYAAQLERSNRDLQNFAYVASHDLQEPLRKIQAFADRLAAKYREGLSDEGRDYLQRMQSAAARMQAMINDLLALSRVTSRGQETAPVDLNAVAQEVVSDLEPRLEETTGRVEVGELPTIAANPLQMRQLLQNLIGNALKFRRDGEPPVVKLGAEQVSPTEVQITVADNGIGFEEKYLDRIFGPFQRLHGRGVYEGTGIGLAICQKIAERHGGSITARSAPGRGSTFLVTLPLTERKTRIGAAS